MIMNIVTALSSALVVSACVWPINASAAAAPAPGDNPRPTAGETHLWMPVQDEVYLQEMGQQVVTDRPATAVAVHGGTAYVVVAGALKALLDGALRDVEGAPGGVKRLRSLDGALWAVAETGTYRLAGQAWQRVDARPFLDLCLHLGKVYAATPNDLFRFENRKFVNIRPVGGYLSSDATVVMEDFSQVLADPVEIGPMPEDRFLQRDALPAASR